MRKTAGWEVDALIIPCIDLLGGKVVQLIQGRDKALEVDSPLTMVAKFEAFPQIQVIDLDAALDKGRNDALVELVAARALVRAGGGVRSAERAGQLLDQGVYRVIVGTAAFNRPVLKEIVAQVGKERVIIALDSRGGRVVVHGWQVETAWTAEELIPRFEPYCSGFLCTYVDKEGMLQGTDLAWFRSLRAVTDLELTAAGGITTRDEIDALHNLGIHAALGMAIYTGHLDLASLLDPSEVNSALPS